MSQPRPSMCAMSTFILLVSLATHSSAQSQEYNYTDIFTTNNQTAQETCVKLGGRASNVKLKGSFIIPSLGQFEMGETKFMGALDAFGKLHRFRFNGSGGVCFTARMMETGFYNESVSRGKIAPGLLFIETEPKRPYYFPTLAWPIWQVRMTTRTSTLIDGAGATSVLRTARSRSNSTAPARACA